MATHLGFWKRRISALRPLSASTSATVSRGRHFQYRARAIALVDNDAGRHWQPRAAGAMLWNDDSWSRLEPYGHPCGSPTDLGIAAVSDNDGLRQTVDVAEHLLRAVSWLERPLPNRHREAEGHLL